MKYFVFTTFQTCYEPWFRYVYVSYRRAKSETTMKKHLEHRDNADNRHHWLRRSEFESHIECEASSLEEAKEKMIRIARKYKGNAENNAVFVMEGSKSES